MMKKALFVTAMLLIWVTQLINLGMVKAVDFDLTNIELNKTCQGNNLYIYAEWEQCEGGTCTVNNHTQNQTCPYGCDQTSLKCNPPDYMIYVYVIIGIIILIVVVKWLVSK